MTEPAAPEPLRPEHRGSGAEEVMDAMFGSPVDRAGKRCMRRDCRHTVPEHLDPDAPTTHPLLAEHVAGRRPCHAPGCGCANLLEEP